MMTIATTTMTTTITNDLVFLGNNQPWSDSFLAEGWWVISKMITTMRMTTMVTTMRRTFLSRTYDDDDDDDDDGNK